MGTKNKRHTPLRDNNYGGTQNSKCRTDLNLYKFNRLGLDITGIYTNHVYDRDDGWKGLSGVQNT